MDDAGFMRSDDVRVTNQGWHRRPGLGFRLAYLNELVGEASVCHTGLPRTCSWIFGRHSEVPLDWRYMSLD